MGKKPRTVRPEDYDDALIELFWSKVIQTDNPDECWLWGPNKDKPTVYGTITLRSGLQVTTHRFSLILFYGGDSQALNALHSCDTPACCNPHHLWWGTNSDNMKDCSSKRRMAQQQPGWRTQEDTPEYTV